MKPSSNTADMTKGSPVRLILTFSIPSSSMAPFILSNSSTYKASAAYASSSVRFEFIIIFSTSSPAFLILKIVLSFNFSLAGLHKLSFSCSNTLLLAHFPI